MTLLDIHTHHTPEFPGREILNCFLENFMPQPGYYYSVGIHPWHLHAFEDWTAFEKVINHPQVLAVGEAGLDKVCNTPFQLQIDCFKKQILWADKIGKPLIIHAVGTYNEIIQLKKEFCPRNPWIVHGFRGRKELALQLVKHGIYLSFGKEYREESIRAVPIEYVFLETDESDMDICFLYERAANCISLRPPGRLIQQVQQNIDKVF